VQIAHRRLHVGMAHPFLDTTDIGLADHARAETCDGVVEAQGAKPGSAQSGAIATEQRRRVEVRPASPRKTRSSSVVCGPRRARRASASATSCAMGTERTLPLFGVESSPFV
jgi:hypothetical protein